MKEKTNQTFTGQYFHTFTDVPGYPVKYQGRVLADAGGGYFLCELYSWLDGQSGNSRLFHLSTMKDWFFYPTAKQMNYVWETSLKHRKEKKETTQ